MTCAESDLMLMLAARRTLAEALAEALGDPFDLREQEAGFAVKPQALRELWAGFAHLHQEVKQDQLGLGEMAPARVSIEPLSDWLSMDLEARGEVWQRVFGLVMSKVCPPYETEYTHWKDPTYRAQQLADIAGFYAAFGFDPQAVMAERQDHIAAELLFLATLQELWRVALERGPEDDAPRVCAEAACAFLRDHVIWWMPTFARCIERRIEQLAAENPGAIPVDGLRVLAGVAHVLRAQVAIERLAHGLAPNHQIISPRIVAEDPGDDSCHTCASASCASA